MNMHPSLQSLVEQLSVHDRTLVRLLNGYQLGEVIAEGEMAVVLAARDRATGAPLALKFPGAPTESDRGLADLDDRIEALRYEADWLQRVNSSGIGEVVRLVRDGSHERLPFLALERLDGPSLSDALHERAFSAKEATDFLLRASGTLADLHKLGFCHYDLKPGNFLLHRGAWVLIDPASEENETCEHIASGLTQGPLRDVVALGRTVLAMELGAEGETCISDDSEFQEYPSLRKLLIEMLRESGKPVPTADDVHRRAKRAFKRCFADET